MPKKKKRSPDGLVELLENPEVAKRVGLVFEDAEKAGFRPDQLRNPDGTWAPEGGGGAAGGGNGRAPDDGGDDNGDEPNPLSFKDKDAAARELERRFPGAEVRVFEGWGGGTEVGVSYSAVNSGSMFVNDREGSDLSFEALYTIRSEQGKEFARNFLRAVLDTARATKAPAIKLAAVNIGAYLWPKIGFELNPGVGPAERYVKEWMHDSGLLERVKNARELGLDMSRVDRIIKEGGVNTASRLANLTTPVSEGQLYAIMGDVAQRYDVNTENPTLGKALMIGTRGSYSLPREKYPLLEAYINRVSKMADKAEKKEGEVISIEQLLFEDMERQELEELEKQKAGGRERFRMRDRRSRFVETGEGLRIEKAEETLYERLGGSFAIAAVVDAFSDALINNPKVGKDSPNPRLREWHRNQLDRLPGLKFMRTLWVISAAGGPIRYKGTRPDDTQLGLANAHRRLKITSEEFDEVARVLGQTLTRFKVPEAEKKEVLEAFAAHKSEVVSG